MIYPRPTFTIDHTTLPPSVQLADTPLLEISSTSVSYTHLDVYKRQELDGEAQKNVKAIAKIVKVMHDEGIGYGSIHHPVDTCQACGYKGAMYDKCPVCQRENLMRMRRIAGYLTGDLSTWNSAKRAEERDRVKHG